MGRSQELIKSVTENRLKLIINPTEHCNLRCIGCYETFQIGRMPEAVANGVINLVARRIALGRLRCLEVDFFGGEPLANWPLVYRMTSELTRLCRAGHVAFHGGMTTNGTLLYPDRIEALSDLAAFFYQITLSGPKEIHDCRRSRKDGRGSFDEVWATMHHLKRYLNTTTLIRIHFDPASYPSLIEADGFVSRVVSTFLKNDPRFKLHFHALGHWGGRDDHLFDVFATIQEREAKNSLIDAAIAAGCSPEQLLQFSPDAKLGESGHAICYAAEANSFLIRADGRVGKCTVALEDPSNTIGHITEKGDLLIDHDKHLPWLQGLVTGDAAFLACPKAFLLDRPSTRSTDRYVAD